MKRKIRNASNFKAQKNDIEITKGRSMTIQGEAQKISDLLRMHSQGLLPPGTIKGSGVFNPDPSHDDYDFQELMRMDIAELDEIRAENAEILKAMELKIQQSKDEHLKGAKSLASTPRDEPEAKGRSGQEKTGNAVDSSKPSGETE